MHPPGHVAEEPEADSPPRSTNGSASSADTALVTSSGGAPRSTTPCPSPPNATAGTAASVVDVELVVLASAGADDPHVVVVGAAGSSSSLHAPRRTTAVRTRAARSTWSTV